MTSNQLSLEQPAVKLRNGANDTSRAAARLAFPRSGTTRKRVLQAVAFPGGATAEQVEKRTNLGGNTVRPRLLELREGGWVHDSGERRKTRSGARAVVYRVTQKTKGMLI